MTSTLKTNAIEPEGGTTNLVIGESGQNTVISNNDIRANVLQDAGGNAVFTSDGSGNVSGVNSGLCSAMVLLSTQTASNSASLSFTSGIDSTYKEYIFKFYDANPASDGVDFSFQVNADGGSGFNETITSSCFRTYHKEDDTTHYLGYDADHDQAQGTAYQSLSQSNGNGSDECCAGVLHLFSPMSTVVGVTHFYSRFNGIHDDDVSMADFIAGYINTTTVINEISFKMPSGNFDGTIQMYGIK